jgi:hypothetical protein
MKLGLVVFLVACGGGAATTGTGNTAEPGSGGAGGLPAAYAGLFEAKTLTFPAEYVTSMDGQTDKSAGTVTCVISEVKDRAAGGKTAQLECSSDLNMPATPSGTYVGTAEGLWHVDDADAALDPQRRLLGATPAEGRSEIKGEDPDMESGEAYSVSAHAGGWCAAYGGWGGDEGGWQLCFKDGAIVGGSGFFAGGSTQDLYFGEVKR